MRGKRCGYYKAVKLRVRWNRSRHTDPFVVRFMNNFIQERYVQPAMDPVNAIVGEKQESTKRCYFLLLKARRTHNGIDANK